MTNKNICFVSDFPYTFITETLAQRLQPYGLQLYFNDNKLDGSDKPDLVLFMDIPKKIDLELLKKKYPVPWMLLLFECEVIKSWNFELANHQYFNSILTWHDGLVDNKKYIKFNFTAPLANKIRGNKKGGFCTFINSIKKRKKLTSELENCIYRETVMRWFAKHKSSDFRYYGKGWMKKFPHNFIYTYLSDNKIINAIAGNKYRCYGGWVDNKLQKLSDYKFILCFENAIDIPGYITEKIFDAFIAGAVPIYLGAPNITDYIPGSCFIDYRQFNSPEKLFNHLSTLSQADYNHYINQIDQYLASDAFLPFKASTNIDIIAKKLLNSLDCNHFLGQEVSSHLPASFV